jgi:hypothetical protein
VGLCGVVYAVIVARRMRVQTAYQPVFEDWLLHVLLPLAYAIFLCFRAIQNLFEPRFLNTDNIYHFILCIEFQLLLSLFLSLVR